MFKIMIANLNFKSNFLIYITYLHKFDINKNKFQMKINVLWIAKL